METALTSFCTAANMSAVQPGRTLLAGVRHLAYRARDRRIPA